MATSVCEAGEPHEFGLLSRQGEAELAALVHIALHGRLH
jgi:hypothetical protein